MEDEKIWKFLLGEIGNEYGVSALMGNLYVESKLNPKALQSSYARRFGLTNDEYTALIDIGTYSLEQFKSDGAGYGLAQWTYWSRKESLYKFIKSIGASIGDLDAQLRFLIDELKKYGTVMDTLRDAKSIREASDIIVKRYERPKNQTESFLENRAKQGQVFFDKFSKTSKIPYVIAVENVNIRMGNGKEYAKIGTLKKGEKLPYVAESPNGWYAVKYKTNVCWVSCGFSKIL